MELPSKLIEKRHVATMREYEWMVVNGMSPGRASRLARTSVVYNCGVFARMQVESPGARVGLFWVDFSRYAVYAVTASVSGEEYAFHGAKSFSPRGVMHYNSSESIGEAWDVVRKENPAWKSFGPDIIPRGRVSLESGPGAKRRFTVWISEILDTQECREAILRKFSLVSSMAVFVVSDLTAPRSEEEGVTFYPIPFLEKD